MSRATLIASLTERPAGGSGPLPGAPPEVEILELRSDLLPGLEVEELRSRFPGRVLFTLRSRKEGGEYEGSRARRHQMLMDAAEHCDLVDLEADRDLVDPVLAAIPPEKRVISWHGSASGLGPLKSRFERIEDVPARWYKLVPTFSQEGEETVVLALLHALERDDVICFAGGETGSWTRLLAPRFGAPVVYGALGSTPAAPGQLSVDALVGDYGLPELREIHGLYGIVGNPVSHSLSPRLHNRAYRELDLPYLYLPFHVETFGDFWLDVVEAGTFGVLGLPLRGFSVTAPFKASALAVAGATSPRAEWIGGANTLVQREGVWEASSTDPEGVVDVVTRRGIEVRGRPAAVVGAGGAGCAAAAGLHAAGAKVRLFNRSVRRREEAQRRLGLPCRPLEEFDPAAFPIVVHATALGRRGELPFGLEGFGAGHIVVDLVYGPEPTPLIRKVRELGATGVDGREVLLYQGVHQFHAMTGLEYPMEVGRAVLGLEEEP